jgi:predicted hydrocarbon binding protein
MKNEATNMQIVYPSKASEVLKLLSVNDESGAVCIGNVRTAILPASGLFSMVSRIIRIFGEAVALGIIYEVGMEFGKAYYLEVKKMLGLGDPLSLSTSELCKLLTSLGFGKFEFISGSLESPFIVLRLSNPSVVMPDSKITGCHLIRGFLAGLLTRIFRVELYVLETRCISKGDQYCEFEVRDSFTEPDAYPEGVTSSLK